MKVLIVSDTHKKNGTFYDVWELEKPDMIIHCGDAEGSEFEFREVVDCPMEIILGNNDFFSDLPRELMLDIGQYKVWVVHGHGYYVSTSTELLKAEAGAKGANIVMFGHTHRPLLDIGEELIVLNPGSLSFPRQEGRRPSYIVMDVAEDGSAQFEVKFIEKN